jgi:autophagy-related protein 17
MASSASSSAGSRSLHSRHDSVSPGDEGLPSSPDDVPVEILVEHLLHAKRSLSSITHVLRANELATHARQLHEETVILSAQTAFLRRSINEQIGILNRVRKGLLRTYDWSKTDFDQLIKQLDASGDRLSRTMDMLRQTPVDAVFRPAGEEQKTLLDFIDENAVESSTDAVKGHIMELQVSSMFSVRLTLQT